MFLNTIIISCNIKSEFWISYLHKIANRTNFTGGHNITILLLRYNVD